MLSQETLDSVAVIIGINADELAQAISNEQEVKLELPTGRFLTAENESKLLDNHGKRKYDEGKSKTLKEIFEGKDKETFLNDFKTSILTDAKLEPNEKLDQATKTINSLKESLEAKEKEVLSIKSDAENTKKRANALSILPALREDLGIQKNEALDFILGSVEQKEDGIYKNGKLIVNEHQEAVSFNDFLSQEVNARGWAKKTIQGNGGKDGKKYDGKPASYSAYQKHIESKGWNEAGQEARQYLATLQAENPKFDLDN